MMWNNLIVIRPELVPVIIGGLYLLSIALLRKISIPKVILSLLILLTLAPISIVTYVYIFSATYIAQALIFMVKKEKLIAYKYFLLAFLTTVTCLDLALPHYKVILLLIAAAQIFLASEKSESQNIYLYVSNLALMAGLTLKLQPLYLPNISSIIVLVLLLAVCLRILLLNTVTILALFPVFILGSMFSEKMILIAIFIYVTYFSFILHTQKYKLTLLILILLPFLDFGIFSVSFTDILNKNNLLDPFYLSIAVGVLTSACAAKALETEMKKNRPTFSYTTILMSLFPALLIVIKVIETELASISLPVPLFAAIPIIFIEAKYLSFLSKVNLKINFKTPTLITYCFRWLTTAPKTIHIKSPKRWIQKITGYIDTKILKQDYTSILVLLTLIMVAIVFLYLEVL